MQFTTQRAAWALALSMVAGQVGAASIAITNADFEAVQRSDGGIAIGAHAPGWTFVNGTYGVYNPSLAFYSNAQITDPPNSGVIGTMSGPMVAFIFSSANAHLTATTAHSVVAGERYQLTVAVGTRSNSSPGTTYLALLDGDSELARHDVGVGERVVGSFTDITLSYTASAADAGALRVRLGQDGGNHSDFDNVRLTVSAVPEPASWALLVCGAGLLVALRRQRGG